MKIKSGMGRGRIAPEIEKGRLPLIEAARNFRFSLGRKTPRAFFWVEWDPSAAVPGDAVLVMAEANKPEGRP